MKPYPVSGSSADSAKTSASIPTANAAAPGRVSASPAWGSGEGTTDKRRTDAPQPPPVWTRYIDSRLKQFCTR